MNSQNRAFSAWDLYKETGSIDALEDAIIATRAAVQDTSDQGLKRVALFNNLGSMLRERFGNSGNITDIQEAIDLLTQALRYAHLDDPLQAAILSNLGTMLSVVGRREEALDAAIQAVEIRRRLATENPSTHQADLAMSLNNLGTMLSDVGRREEALDAAIQAVEIRRRLATENPSTHQADLAMSLNNLGTMLSDVGRREEALDAAIQAVEIRRRLATENPSTHQADLAMSLNNLGNRLLGMGRYEEASNNIESALEIYRTLTPSNPGIFKPDLVAASANLAASYLALGDTERAIPLYEHVLDESVLTLGNDHVYTLSIRSNLAEAYETAGAVERALLLYEEALADSTRVLGESHPRTLSIRNALTGTSIRSRIADSRALTDRTQSTKLGIVSQEPDTTENSTTINHSAEDRSSRSFRDDEFSNFYRENIRHLVSFLVWQGASLHTAADLAQDAMTKAYAKWDDLRNPQAWVRVAASRELMRHSSQSDSLEGDEAPNLTALLPARDAGSEWEEHHRILELISQLPLRQRQVLAWTFDGYTPSEISSYLGVSPPAVRTNLMRARRHIAQLLRDQEQSSP